MTKKDAKNQGKALPRAHEERAAADLGEAKSGQPAAHHKPDQGGVHEFLHSLLSAEQRVEADLVDGPRSAGRILKDFVQRCVCVKKNVTCWSSPKLTTMSSNDHEKPLVDFHDGLELIG